QSRQSLRRLHGRRCDRSVWSRCARRGRRRRQGWLVQRPARAPRRVVEADRRWCRCCRRRALAVVRGTEERGRITQTSASPLLGGQRRRASASLSGWGERIAAYPHPLELASLVLAGLPARGRRNQLTLQRVLRVSPVRRGLASLSISTRQWVRPR